MRSKLYFGLICPVLMMLAVAQAFAADLERISAALQQGGHVLVLRHAATDDRQQDVYPFRFDDMSAQRQLSDTGRETARRIGEALKRARIPIGEVATSKLNRAVESALLITGKKGTPLDELTDSGAGRTSAMIGTAGGGDALLGGALRALTNVAPAPETNTIIVTHKTNIIDAFGKELSDIAEAEMVVLRPREGGSPDLVARLKSAEWIGNSGK